MHCLCLKSTSASAALTILLATRFSPISTCTPGEVAASRTMGTLSASIACPSLRFLRHSSHPFGRAWKLARPLAIHNRYFTILQKVLEAVGPLAVRSPADIRPGPRHLRNLCALIVRRLWATHGCETLMASLDREQTWHSLPPASRATDSSRHR